MTDKRGDPQAVEQSPEETLRADNESGAVAFVVGGILFIPLSFGAVWGLLFQVPKPQTFLQSILHLIGVEFAICWAAFFTIGFFWGITRHRSLKRLVDKAASRIAWIIATTLAIAILVACVQALWNQLMRIWPF